MKLIHKAAKHLYFSNLAMGETTLTVIRSGNIRQRLGYYTTLTKVMYDFSSLLLSPACL